MHRNRTISVTSRALLIALSSLGALLLSPNICFAQQGALEPILQIDGGNSNDSLGTSVAGLGDVDADGTPDFAVGTPLKTHLGLTTAGQVTVYSGATGTSIYTFNGQASGDQLGFSVAGAGDVDNDGYDDIIASARFADGFGLSSSGAVYVYSGKDGALLHEFEGGSSYENFGASVATAGDIDADGMDDLIVGAPGADFGGHPDAGTVTIFSGATGLALLQVGGLNDSDSFGSSVSSIGDLDFDGTPDFVVGSRLVSVGGQFAAGQVTVHSGATGQILQTQDGVASLGFFGGSVAGIGDVNQDGFPDYLAGAYNVDHGLIANAGAAFAYSGATGSLLYQWNGSADSEKFGIAVAAAGDANNDGYPDMLVGASNASPGGLPAAGSALLYSGRTGALLNRFDGPSEFDGVGRALASVGDLNGNGLDDFITGAPAASPAGNSQAGSAFVISMNPILTATAQSFSSSSGALIGLEMDFPDSAAMDQYKILMSASGTDPFHYGVDIPLTLDRTVLATFNGDYPFRYSNGMQGVLNAAGDGLADVSAMPGFYSSQVGLTVWFSAIANKPGYLPEFSSLPIAITIEL